ncbi:MarR family winged helix-turn-helix transcriptional regulator [Nocardia exalbida]|uniref:MarR family winged helix-turn-helix transcriptional regulator n=1 Tax=Nocardia exalbida TaxID=290231 RepID=UPI000310E8E3|nr:MarR family transcriptional regulator [Nocardia exalbida]
METTWLNVREMAVWQNFLAAGALVGREVERQLKREGLSHTQYEVLVRLADAPEGRLRMTELAEALYTSKSGLTYQVTQLEKTGLLVREACPTDVRGVIAVLTAAGRERLAQVAPGHVATVRRVLVDVLTDAQQGAVADSLGEVARRLAP